MGVRDVFQDIREIAGRPREVLFGRDTRKEIRPGVSFRESEFPESLREAAGFPSRRRSRGFGSGAVSRPQEAEVGLSSAEKNKLRQEIENKTAQEIGRANLKFRRTRFTDRNVRLEAQNKLSQTIANLRTQGQLQKIEQGVISAFNLQTTTGSLRITPSNVKQVKDQLRLGRLTEKQRTEERTRQRGEVAGLTLEPVRPEKGLRGLLGKFQRQAETTRTIGGIETGGEVLPILKQQAKGAGIGIGLSLLGSAVFLDELRKDPAGTLKALPEGVRNTILQSGRIGTILKEQPGLATGFVVGEVLQLKAGQKITPKVGEFLETGVTRLSPKFRKVIQKTVNVPVDGGTIKLKIVGGIDTFAEPLSSQAKLAGTKVTAVSAQRDIFGTLVRREIEINKPIPNEAFLSKSTAKQLKSFRAGNLPRNKLIELNKNIFKETRGGGNLLETSFFADPRGRIRPSRLGLAGGEKEANLLDILSGDVTFKRGKPQVLFFDNVKVAKFPPALRSIENKLKKGIALSPAEEAKLQNFQLSITGEFKPIGFLSKEPEVTLAKGEVIRRRSTSAVTIINGRRVPIIRTEVVRDVKLSKLFQKASLGKATAKELAELKKGTGIDVSSILRKSKFVSPTGLGISSGIAISKGISPRIFGKVSSSKLLSKRIPLPLSSGISPVSVSRRAFSTSLSKVGGSGTSAIRPIVRTGVSPLVSGTSTGRPFPRAISGLGSGRVFQPTSGIVTRRVPRLLRTPRKVFLPPTPRKLPKRFNGGGRDFSVFVRKRGKDTLLIKTRSIPRARKLLKKELASTLRASGFITDRAGQRLKPKITKGFRLSKVDPLRIVERRRRRLDSTREVKSIQEAKRIAPKKLKKVFKPDKNNFKNLNRRKNAKNR